MEEQLKNSISDEIFSRLGEAFCIDSDGSLVSLIQIATAVGLNSQELEEDLVSTLRQRILMWLIKKDPSRNFNERRRAIVRRLTQLSSHVVSDSSLQAIAQTLAKLEGEVSSSHEQTKKGVGTTSESLLFDLLDEQHDRCAACGIPFKSHVCGESTYFDGGFEPLAEMQLEHVEPFYFSGNHTALEVLCPACNGLKNDRFGVHEDGFVVCSNHLRPRNNREILRRMAFWTVYRKRRCQTSGCTSDTRNGIMLVCRNTLAAPWTYGNLSVVCDSHATKEAWYMHEDHL